MEKLILTEVRKRPKIKKKQWIQLTILDSLTPTIQATKKRPAAKKSPQTNDLFEGRFIKGKDMQFDVEDMVKVSKTPLIIYL